MAEINKIIGTEGPDSLEGTTGNDSIDALAGNDTIVAKQGGDDIVNAGAGDDIIGMGQELTSADTIDGGAGTDVMYFTDSNNASTDLDNVTNVEQIILGDASTNITAKSTLVADGATLSINGANLTNNLVFDGSSVVVGSFDIQSGTGNDSITGGDKADTIIAKLGGNDTIVAGKGDDIIGMGDSMTASDKIDGGDGNDILYVKDTDGTTTTLNQVTNVETIIFGDSETNVTTDTDLVASGKTLNVDASRITTSTLTWDGSAETNGSFNITGSSNDDSITGGAKADTIVAGAGDDQITAGGGNDVLDGGAGDDTFTFATAGDLTKNVVVDGGEGTDSLTYTVSTPTTATDLSQVTNVESITVKGAGAVIKTVDGLVAADATVKLDASVLSAGLDFNGAAETDGNFNIIGSDYADTITAGQGADKVSTGALGDTIYFNTYLQSTDTVDGGAGADTLEFTDNGQGANELKNVSNIEAINLGNAKTEFKIWDDNSTSTLTIDATKVKSSVNIDGSAETDADLTITGSNGADSITGGAGDDTLAGKAGNDVLIAKTGGTDAVDGGAGDDVFGFGDTLTSADAVTGGDGTDTLWFTDGNSAVTDLDGVSEIERINLGNADTVITVKTGTVISTAGGTLTVDASAITSLNTFTFTGSDVAAATTEKYYITGGAGDDKITGGDLADTILAGDGDDKITGGVGADVLTGGAGDDIFYFAASDVAKDEVIDGGAGTADALSMAASVDFSDAKSISNIEQIVITGANYATFTAAQLDGKAIELHGEAATAQYVQVNLPTDGGSVDLSKFTQDSSWDASADYVNITGSAKSDNITGTSAVDHIASGLGTDAINAGAGDDIITVVADAAGTINGGEGTDTVNIAGDATGITSLTNVETIDVGTGGATMKASVLSGQTFTLGSTAAAKVALTLTGTTSNDVIDMSNVTPDATNPDTLTINGLAGKDTITGTSGDDAIAGGDGDDVIDGGAGDDAISGGEGADAITTGAGTDTVNLTEATAAADTVTITGTSVAITGFDAGGTATDDDLAFSIAAVEGIGTSDWVATDGTSVVAGEVSLQTITGADTIGAATDELLVANLAGNIADTDALETALEASGGLALTTTNAIAAGDSFLVAYDDGSDTYIATVKSTSGATSGGTFTSGDLTATNVVTLAGVIDVSTLDAADFADIIS